MSPAQLRSLVGLVLVMRFPAGDGPAWRVLGYGGTDIRLKSLHTGRVHSAPIADVAAMLASGAVYRRPWVERRRETLT